jgi:predicted aspartyl protease
MDQKEKITYLISAILKNALNGFLFLVLILLLSGCSFSETYRTSAGYCFIPFQKIGQQIPVVEAFLNGKKAWFIIDTGATYTLLNASEASQFGFFVREHPLHRKTEVNGLGGKLILHETFSCRIDLGPLEIKHFPWKSGNINRLSAKILKNEKIRLAGILGSDLLSRYGINVNYDNQTISYRMVK